MDAGGPRADDQDFKTIDSTVTIYCMVLLFAQFSKFMLILFLVKLNHNISSCASAKNALGKLLMDHG